MCIILHGGRLHGDYTAVIATAEHPKLQAVYSSLRAIIYITYTSYFCKGTGMGQNLGESNSASVYCMEPQ